MDINNETGNKLSILPILRQIPFFASLNEQDHQELIQHIECQLYPANYVIFKEGDDGEKMYLIRRGSVVVSKQRTDGKPADLIANIGPGQFFGEMALISNEKRNATVIAQEEIEVFTLSKSDLFTLLENNPDMAGRVNSEYLDRFKANDRRSAEQAS